MSDPINDGGAAFPTGEIFDRSGKIKEYKFTGMSLRDYFAAKALSAELSKTNVDWQEKCLAEYSYEIADAMLAARAKGGQDE